jgi:hypothetical protein
MPTAAAAADAIILDRGVRDRWAVRETTTSNFIPVKLALSVCWRAAVTEELIAARCQSTRDYELIPTL